MLRAIFRRRFKDNTSGIVIENQIYSIAFENHDIENELRAGGFGETGFEVRELLGVEVFDKPMPVQCDPPPVRDYKEDMQKIVDANEKLVKELKDGTNTVSK